MKVYNKKHGITPPGAVYVGRPTKWGNPYSHKQGTLAKHRTVNARQAVEAYEHWITKGEGRHLLDDLHELEGKDLECWCSPGMCHADVLLLLANP